MKTHRIGATLAALLLGSGLALAAPAAPAKAETAAKPSRVLAVEKLPFPKLNPITEPVVVRETLPNGVKLLLIEDHELPQVAWRAMIRGGRLVEPKAKFGVSNLFGEVWRSGGTAKLTGDQLDEKLERIGASIESGADLQSIQLSGSSLTDTLDQVLELYADVLLRPAFAENKVDLAKTQIKSGISRRNDEPMGIARREFGKLVYGANSPLAREIEYADVDALTRDDVVAYHRQYVRPDQMILAVWGDFKAPQLKARLEALFAGWAASGPAVKAELPAIPAATGSINYVEKKDVAQTFLILGHQGLRYDHPDFAAVKIMEDILGGGFSSRIFVTVRTVKGLAYGAGGAMIPEYDYPGTFYFFTSTKPESTTEALAAVLGEIDKIRKDGVTDAELTRAKDGFLNQFAFDFDSKGKIANRLLTYDFHGYPADFNGRVRDAVLKVSKADVLRVAQQHLHPEKLAILALGDKGKFDKPLTTFATYGAVRDIDITIPAPKAAAAPPATPESLARGKELLQKAAKAKGEGLAAVKDVTTEGSLNVETPGGPMKLQVTSVFALPDRQHNAIQTPMGVIQQVVTPDGAWMVIGPNTQDMPGAQADEQRDALLTDLGGVLLFQRAATLEAQALGKQPFEGKDAEAVLVRTAKPVTLFLAPDTFEVVGIKRQGITQEGPAEIVVTYGKYETASGVALPMEMKASANGKQLLSGTSTSMKVNVGADPKLFEKAKK